MTAPGASVDGMSLAELTLMAGRDPLAAELARSLAVRCGVSSGASIAIGFSGGPDSTALLVLLHALASRRKPLVGRLLAVHVNHGMRPESRQESTEVEAFCDSLGIDVDVRSVSVPQQGGNRSELARNARYRALTAAAEEHGSDFVATAHHAEDRFETMLQALCRGAGVSGLTHPQWARPLGEGVLIRPLLGCSRSELRAFCTRAEVPFLEDPSNSDPRTARGLLRKEVLPVLEARWPGAAKRASAAADRLAVASSALDDLVQDRFGSPDLQEWPRSVFRGLDPEVTTTLLRRAVLLHACPLATGAESNPCSARLLEAALAISDDDLELRDFGFLGDRVRVKVGSDRVSVISVA